MYGKPDTTCFKFQVYMYGSEALTYFNAIYILYGSITFIHLKENFSRVNLAYLS
jgi:hypothetical protein